MGSVFPVRRKKDNEALIAKMVLGKDALTRQCFHDEIGLMRIHTCDYIVKCFDSMDSMNKLWCFLERMDGDMESIINYCKDNYEYDESFIKYTLYCVL